MITDTSFTDVVARWGTMYGGFFGLAVVIAAILLIADIVVPVLVFFDARRRGRSPIGWVVALVAIPIICSLPALLFIVYSPIIGTLALALPLIVLSIYMFSSAASPAMRPAFAGAAVPQVAMPGGPEPARISAQQAQAIAGAPQAAVSSGSAIDQAGTRFVGGAPAGLFGVLVATSGVDRGREFRIEGDTIEIGRDATSQVRLSDPETSRRHSKIKIENGIATIFDLASTNGTFVNGEKVTSVQLGDNDVIRIGTTDMVVKLLGPAAGQAVPAKGGTMMKQPAKPATVFKEPATWTVTVDAGPDHGKKASLATAVVVGRDDTCDLVLADPEVSRSHARIEVKSGAVFVEDLESSNGTEILRPDGVAVAVKPGKSQPLAEGEKVRVGETDLSFAPPGS